MHNSGYTLDIDRDDDPHLKHFDGAEVDSYERFGDSCYLVYVDGEQALVAGHELIDTERDDR